MTTLVDFVRELCSDYELQPFAIYLKGDDRIDWPLKASSETDLRKILSDAGKFEPLPREPATLANIVEVSLTRFLERKIAKINDVEMRIGNDRGYPDVELSGKRFGGYQAIDIKTARRSSNKKQTQSRITLYTGNTYFRHPTVKWPSILRPFADYETHLDLIALYTLDVDSSERVKDVEIIVQESWRIASRERSSTTREYIGAEKSIEALRKGRGAFSSEKEFYTYWRAFPFRIPPSVSKQLDKALREMGG